MISRQRMTICLVVALTAARLSVESAWAVEKDRPENFREFNLCQALG
jgi:hypothetical protein